MHNLKLYIYCGVGILPAQYMQVKYGTAYLLLLGANAIRSL
ncbi:hypothetical protein FDUTEX481_01687 [Tolypothrix sp. PCC 7601]|nr:hypothetical protein FDUTEX481_01687 [Tolypothrix sp. PCC 7601]